MLQAADGGWARLNAKGRRFLIHFVETSQKRNKLFFWALLLQVQIQVQKQRRIQIQIQIKYKTLRKKAAEVNKEDGDCCLYEHLFVSLMIIIITKVIIVIIASSPGESSSWMGTVACATTCFFKAPTNGPHIPSLLDPATLRWG